MSAAKSKVADIAFVRQWFKGSHITDTDALASFNEGRGVFDVGPDTDEIEAFVAKHHLEVRRDDKGLISHLRLPQTTIYIALETPKTNFVK